MRRPRLFATALPVVAVSAALVVAAPATGGPQPVTTADSKEEMVRTAAGAVRRARPRAMPSTAIVRVERGATLSVRARPGGPHTLRLGDATAFGSPQTLAVIARRGRWLGVSTPELPNGRLGWIDRRTAPIAVSTTRWSIVVDLSDRRTVLRRGGRSVRKLAVAVGRQGSRTPIGRFAVTDKLPGSGFGAYYGCCILALSATQPNLPPDWTGGNRMAIHGTDDPATIGTAASAGCLRAADSDLRVLTSRVPLGTPVVIRQ